MCSVPGIARIASLFAVKREPYNLCVGSRIEPIAWPFEALRAATVSIFALYSFVCMRGEWL